MPGPQKGPGGYTTSGTWNQTKPGSRATTLNFAEPAPLNESPHDKVKRLREAANRAKLAQVTQWDYIYLYGRMAADFGHRTVVYGIIFGTGCVGVLAVFSIGDMVVYNRRKRAIYWEDQEREQTRILDLARSAVRTGTATPAQTALVEGIAEEETLMEQKKAERKIPSRLLWWLHGEYREDKALKEQRRLAVEDFKLKEAEGGKSLGVTQALQEARAAAPASTVGGELDHQAAKVAAFANNTAQAVSKGWLGWLWGSKKE